MALATEPRREQFRGVTRTGVPRGNFEHVHEASRRIDVNKQFTEFQPVWDHQSTHHVTTSHPENRGVVEYWAVSRRVWLLICVSDVCGRGWGR